MAVLDASVVFEYLADGPGAEVAEERLLQREPLWAPYLIDAEVGHALRRAVRHGALDGDGGSEALLELQEMPLRRISHDALVHFAWDLRDVVTFYDGLYVALAEMLGEPLVTFDAKLARSGVEAKIELLPRDG